MMQTRLRKPEEMSEAVRVSAYAEASEVLLSPHFVQGAYGDDFTAPFLGRTLLAIDGHPHHARRRIESPLFAPEVLLEREHAVTERALDAELSRRRAFVEADGYARADLVELLRRVVMPMAGAIIGLDRVAEDPDSFRRLVRKVDDGLSAASAGIGSDWRSTWEAGVDAREELHREFVEPALERRTALVDSIRRGSLDRGALPTDLITLLLLDYPECVGEDLLREVVLFIVASTDTTVHTATVAVDCALGWLDAQPEPGRSVVDQTFLRAAAQEAARLNPPLHSLPRRATQDVVLSSGRKIARSQLVVVDLFSANRDPSIFGENAESFDPARALGPKTRPYGLAFGLGAHMCSGRAVAMGQISKGGERRELGPQGVVVHMLRAVLGAGARRDPLHPPRVRGGDDGRFADKPRFEVYPVVLGADDPR